MVAVYPTIHDVIKELSSGSRARDVISRAASRATVFSLWADRPRSPEYVKFWIFKIGPLLAEIRPILWSEVNICLCSLYHGKWYRDIPYGFTNPYNVWILMGWWLLGSWILGREIIRKPITSMIIPRWKRQPKSWTLFGFVYLDGPLGWLVSVQVFLWQGNRWWSKPMNGVN